MSFVLISKASPNLGAGLSGFFLLTGGIFGASALLGLYVHLSSEEIGSILGMSEETVGSRLQAATQVMTAAIAGGRRAEATGPR